MNFFIQKNPDFLANYSEAARSLVESLPAWTTVSFALTVFAGAPGCLLLFLKKSVAFYATIASLVGVIVTNIHTFGVTSSTEILAGSLMSLAVAGFIIWYVQLVERKGWIS